MYAKTFRGEIIERARLRNKYYILCIFNMVQTLGIEWFTAIRQPHFKG